jgi:histidinol-phosphate aminotransferase
VIKLASNEGPWGPFPAALEALAAAARELNRYPDGGAYRLRVALAERFGVPFEEVALGAGSDGIVDCLSQALLDPGDEIVCGWPSFPSYVIYARKLAAVTRLVPLRDNRYDLDAIVAAVGPRTKIVYVSYPNNPTGTMNSRAEVERFLDAVPEQVLVVLDQAYFEYIDDPEYLDGVEEASKAGRNVLTLRTFSKIYGLAGLRIGYGIGPAPIVAAVDKVRRPFDLTSDAQAAAVASLADAEAECSRRRRLTVEGRSAIDSALRQHGFDVAGPSVGNFVFADVGEDANGIYQELLRQGVIVRPTAGFGAPTGIRVTVGTPEENLVFAEALVHVRAAAGRR